jgi:hypothetical protein
MRDKTRTRRRPATKNGPFADPPGPHDQQWESLITRRWITMKEKLMDEAEAAARRIYEEWHAGFNENNLDRGILRGRGKNPRAVREKSQKSSWHFLRIRVHGQNGGCLDDCVFGIDRHDGIPGSPRPRPRSTYSSPWTLRTACVSTIVFIGDGEG